MLRYDRASVARGGQLVVDAVSLHARPGEAWAVIGPSGAGKTMLVAAAATAVPLHAGDVLVGGHSVRRQAEAVRRVVGYVPDKMPEWPSICVAGFLELFARAAGLRGTPLAQAVEKGIEMGGLLGRDRERVDALDGGHAKRLLVAKALVHDPQVLLLDDPFGSLDPASRYDLERRIGDAVLMGRSVVAAIDDARVPDCFTHVAVLIEGRLVAAGTNDPATFADGRRWRVLVRCSGRAEQCVAALRATGLDCHSVDLDAVAVWMDLAFFSPADIVATVVRGGIPVDSVGFDPPWTTQLFEGEHVPPAS